MTCGIYGIQHLATGRWYVGYSTNVEHRWRQHGWKIGKSQHHIHRAIHQYGREAFSFVVLEECPQASLCEREAAWVAKLDSYNNGFNMTPGGEFSPMLEPSIAAKVAAHQSLPENRAKRRIANLGHPVSEEARARIGAAQRGKVVSEETRKRMSDAGRGKKRDPESIEKSAMSHRGKVTSEATKEKMRVANTGKVRSEETKARLRAAWVLRKQRQSIATSKE